MKYVWENLRNRDFFVTLQWKRFNVKKGVYLEYMYLSCLKVNRLETWYDGNERSARYCHYKDCNVFTFVDGTAFLLADRARCCGSRSFFVF